MLERYWKPYFDSWTENTSKVLEQFLQSRFYLSSASALMEGLFQGKVYRDRALHGLLSLLGLATYHDQKKMMHQLLRLSAQVEDLSDQLEMLRQQPPSVRAHLGQEPASLEQDTAQPGENRASPRGDNHPPLLELASSDLVSPETPPEITSEKPPQGEEEQG